MKQRTLRGKTLGESLTYQPVELAFGTSGLRGLVRDITNLEAFIGARAFFSYILTIEAARAGQPVYLAGDLRPSTDSLAPEEGGGGEILQAVARAAEASGLVAVYLGKIPSPALMLYALRRGAASVMVTGSHIPFDRNGIKMNKPSGEVMKSDEPPIFEAMQRVRAEEYGRPAGESLFDSRGMLKTERRKPLPPPLPEAESEYILRYTSAFPKGVLSGARILVWQHSAVGRDTLARILTDLGAEAVPAGRSGEFIAVDTEAVNAEMLSRIQALADANGGASLRAVVSTDGDSDRPLVLGVENGRVRFFPGDLLGLVTAEFLGVRHAAVPISVNDAVDIRMKERGAAVQKTRIGSPYVIAAMKEAGWEANGGFLTAARISVPGGGVLDPLPTRDALLPILSALAASLGRGIGLSELFGRLPPRFGKSSLLRSFPAERSRSIIRLLSPADRSVEEARFYAGAVSIRRIGARDALERFPDGSPAAAELLSIHERLARHFTAGDGFGGVEWINWLDGVRIGFSGGDIAHIRPSGNAPELRVYAAAGTQERADRISALGVADGGILRRLEREAAEETAIGAYREHPRAVRIRGAVRHYDWGGPAFIPGLIGAPNPEGKPFAELWIGAHPRAPSLAELGPTPGAPAVEVPLDRLIDSAAESVLGPAACARFGGKLPFLFKVLDAHTMLSIQAHPNKAQAEAGFRKESAAGIPVSGPRRTYPDGSHKPEVHVALTDFWMLHGFRPLEDMAETLSARAPELGRIMPDFSERLGKAGGDEDARRELLRNLYGTAMSLPQADVNAILDPLVQRLERGGSANKDSPDYWALRAVRLFPDRRDRGIFSIYLLNLLHLRPGQGTFQSAGTLHAYLEGVNVELMANSDNVLRGGLTSKHVDVPELLSCLSFRSGKPRILEGAEVSATETEYRTPADEFLLSRIAAEPGAPHRSRTSPGVTCLITVRGHAGLQAGGDALDLRRGGIAMVPAGMQYEIRAEDSGTVLYAACIP
jgi:phosphomannomutase